MADTLKNLADLITSSFFVDTQNNAAGFSSEKATANAYVDPELRSTGVRVEGNIGNVRVGANKDSIQGNMIDAHYTDPDTGLSLDYSKTQQGSDIALRSGEHSIGMAENAMGKTPYYKYQDENKSLEVTPQNVSGTYNKQFDSGSVGIRGEVGKENSYIGVTGQFDF